MTSSPALYLTTILIWGTSWFAIKFQLGVVAPEISLIYRFGLAAAILLIFCVLTSRDLRASRRDHMFIAAQGACLFSGNYLIFYHATALLTSGLIAVVFSSVIFMNMFNGALFLKRRVEAMVLIGALFGICGITLVFWPEIRGSAMRAGTTSTVIHSLLLSIVATYLASVGNILSARNQQAGLPVVQTNTLGMGYGVLVMLLYALISGADFALDYRPGYFLSLLYLAVFGSVLAFGAYLTLIGRIGADRAAYATVLFPIVALVISSVFEDFRWSVQALVGIGCVLCGNLLVTGLPRRRQPVQSQS